MPLSRVHGRIASKAEYYALARRHLLGNTIRQWTWEDFQVELNPPRTVGVRSLTTTSQAVQRYDLAYFDLHNHIASCAKWYNINPNDILIDEQAPDHLSTLKGEVMRTERYLYMRYDQTPGLRMRQAYPTMKHMEGLSVVRMLKHYMDNDSWEMLNDMFDRYPDAMVEFSCYSVRLGRFGLNTIFWECRTHY